MKFAFTMKLRLNAANQSQLFAINKIVDEYKNQGYKLTLRQLYYQLVTKNYLDVLDYKRMCKGCHAKHDGIINNIYRMRGDVSCQKK